MSREIHVRFREGVGVRFPRATRRNIYVASQRAGERVKESVTQFLAKRLKLKVNEEKSAVDRPWKRKFLGYTLTAEGEPRLKVAPESEARLKAKLKDIFRRGRGRSLQRVIGEMKLVLVGWMNYFSLARVRNVFERLDEWIRRRLRVILWRQWKRARTRVKRLMGRGFPEEQAHRSASNGRGPWWNAGAIHMNLAFPKAFFDRLGLVSLLDRHLRLAASL